MCLTRESMEIRRFLISIAHVCVFTMVKLVKSCPYRALPVSCENSPGYRRRQLFSWGLFRGSEEPRNPSGSSLTALLSLQPAAAAFLLDSAESVRLRWNTQVWAGWYIANHGHYPGDLLEPGLHRAPFQHRRFITGITLPYPAPCENIFNS